MTTDEPGNHAPARPRIAIVGPPAAGKRALVAGLTGRAAPSTTTPPLKYPWVIDTKYYEAAVDLVCVRVGGERGGRGGRGDAAAVAVDEEAAQTGLEAAAAEQRAARARVGAADGRAGAAVAALGAAVAALGAEEVTIDDAATAMTASRAGVAQAGRPMRAGVHEPAPPGEAVAPQAHPTASSSSAPTPLSAAAPAEAVVLIFDGGDEASFEAARAWTTATGTALESASIRLCVANKADALGLHTGSGVPALPAWRAGAAAWAAAAGWEWVDAALGAGAAVEAALSAMLADGEAVGLARVKEALEAHMWPGLERKMVGTGGRPHGHAGDGAPAHTSSSDGDGDGDGALEADVTTFDALMAEAAAARDRIRALPDAERRAAAAAMASRLLELVSLEDEEE